VKFTTRQTAKVFPKKTNVFGGCCCRRRNPLPSLLKDKHGSMTRFVTWYTPKHPVAMSETKASANGSFIRRDGYLSFCCHEFLLHGFFNKAFEKNRSINTTQKKSDSSSLEKRSVTISLRENSKE
jgi:hypothetical protein